VITIAPLITQYQYRLMFLRPLAIVIAERCCNYITSPLQRKCTGNYITSPLQRKCTGRLEGCKPASFARGRVKGLLPLYGGALLDLPCSLTL